MPTLNAPSDSVHPESAPRVWFFYSSCSACLPHHRIRIHTDFLSVIPQMRPPGPSSPTASLWKLQVHHTSKSSGPLLVIRALSPHVRLQNNLDVHIQFFICKHALSWVHQSSGIARPWALNPATSHHITSVRKTQHFYLSWYLSESALTPHPFCHQFRASLPASASFLDDLSISLDLTFIVFFFHFINNISAGLIFPNTTFFMMSLLKHQQWLPFSFESCPNSSSEGFRTLLFVPIILSQPCPSP